MPGRNFASFSLAAAIVLAGMASVSAREDARQHATHSAPVTQSRKAESAQIMKDESAQITKHKQAQERARTAQLNSSQIDSQESQLNRGPIVSVGPQARAFQRIRDIAMAPTG